MNVVIEYNVCNVVMRVLKKRNEYKSSDLLKAQYIVNGLACER